MISVALIGPKEALAAYGYLAVFAFVGIESLGVPFPGETMLVTAAIYAGTTGNLSIALSTDRLIPRGVGCGRRRSP